MAEEVSTTNRPAVVLLSGGLDSATVLAMARDQGFACHALSFDYGQRHRFELQAARKLARTFDATSHRTVNIDLAGLLGPGASALTDAAMYVPKGRDHQQMADEIPPTYVPARNTIFLSFALGLAEVLGAQDLFVGVNAIDYSGYPDCRPEFVASYEAMANLATKSGVEGNKLTVHAPLIELTKVQIIEAGLKLGVDYGMTHSCYDPDADTGAPCGACDACRLREDAFAELDMIDPAVTQHD